MPEPDYDAAVEYALTRLRNELSPQLTYHNLWHTQCGVIPAVRRLARACDVSEKEEHLLVVAAAYHDIGFIEQYEDHEEVGARLAARALPRFGFEQEDVECIQELIRATCLRTRPEGRRPEDRLRQIIADADLDVLGRDDFMVRSEMLWREVAAVQSPAPTSRKVWLQEQLAFLQWHRYFTPEAKALRDEGKRRNIVLVEKLIRVQSQQAAGRFGLADVEDEL
jgi:uncharacterized protein